MTQTIEKPQAAPELALTKMVRIKHIENPATGRPFCEAKATHPTPPPPSADQCVVCVSMANPGRFMER